MTQYYVDNVNGNNTNPGTSTGSPWLNVTGVNGKTLNSGDIVSFQGGQSFTDAALATKAGVTYNSYGTGQAMIKPATGGAVTITSVDGVTLDNLYLTIAAGQNATNVVGSSNTSGNKGCDRITVKNCTIDGAVTAIRSALGGSANLSVGIAAARPDATTQTRVGWDTNWLIQNNLVRNCGSQGIIVHGAGHIIENNVVQDTGLNTNSPNLRSIVSFCTGVIIRGNTIKNNNNLAISSHWSNGLIYNNTIHCFMPAGTNGSGIGYIEEDTFGTGGRTYIFNNKMTGIVKFGIQYSNIQTTASPKTVSDEDIVVFNNTIECADAANAQGINISAEGANVAYNMPVNVVVQNNIIRGALTRYAVGFPAAGGKTAVWDYNVYAGYTSGTAFTFNGAGNSYANWKTNSGFDAHSITTDPGLNVFPDFSPGSGASSAIDIGTSVIQRRVGTAKYPTALRMIVTPRRCSSYNLPSTSTVTIAANDSQGLVTALAGTTPKNILISDGTYTTAGTTSATTYFEAKAAHKLYASNLNKAVLQCGVYHGSGIGTVEYHGLKFTITDATKCVQIASYRAVIGCSTTASGGPRAYDCAIDGGNVVDAGVYDPYADGSEYQRLQILNHVNYGLYVNDGNTSSTRAILSISDIYVQTVKNATPGSSNGAAEVGIAIGNDVTNGVTRVKIQDCGWRGMWIGNAHDLATFSDIDIDNIVGTIPSTTTKTGVAIYLDRKVDQATFQNFVLGPTIEHGFVCRTDSNVSGNQAATDCTFKDGYIECNDSTDFDKTVGMLFEQGTLRPVVQNVAFVNMRYACIVDNTNNPPASSSGTSSLNTSTANSTCDYARRGARTPSGGSLTTAATISYIHPSGAP
jgi:hypothetical protein